MASEHRRPLYFSFALACSACAWGTALDSDPSAWNPPARSTEQEAPPADPTAGAPSEGSAGSAGSDVDCDTTQALDVSLLQSSPERGSHRAGEPCLKGCHEAGGSAELAFAAAGTAYAAQGQRVVAAAGREVRGVGGSVLQLDACGNFYAVKQALKAAPSSTQPWLKDPTFRHMEKPLLRVARAGDCNQSGCHDFSGRLNAGIYF